MGGSQQSDSYPWSVICGGRSIGVLALWAKMNVVQFLFPSVFGIILVPGVPLFSEFLLGTKCVSVVWNIHDKTCLQFVFSSRLDYLGFFLGGACILLSLFFSPSSSVENLNTWHVNWGL